MFRTLRVDSKFKLLHLVFTVLNLISLLTEVNFIFVYDLWLFAVSDSNFYKEPFITFQRHFSLRSIWIFISTTVFILNRCLFLRFFFYWKNLYLQYLNIDIIQNSYNVYITVHAFNFLFYLLHVYLLCMKYSKF